MKDDEDGDIWMFLVFHYIAMAVEYREIAVKVLSDSYERGRIPYPSES